MGIFSARQQINLDNPGQVSVASAVRDSLPDPVEYFLEWMGVGAEIQSILIEEIDSHRHPNGEITASGLSDAPVIGRKQTPMTFLRTMLNLAPYAVAAWGTDDLTMRDSRAASKIIHSMTHEQGVAAAVTWVYQARPDWNDPLGFSFLSPQIVNGWTESLEWVRNIDVSRALKNWTK